MIWGWLEFKYVCYGYAAFTFALFALLILRELDHIDDVMLWSWFAAYLGYFGFAVIYLRNANEYDKVIHNKWMSDMEWDKTTKDVFYRD